MIPVEVWGGLAFGFLGSLHCVGMCGPIALALPLGYAAKGTLLLSRVLYNLGRVITYGLLGIVAGVLGQTIAMAGFQQALSIVLGISIALVVLAPARFVQRIIPPGITGRLFGKMKAVWGRLFQSRSAFSLLMIGVLNGFLPCGFVYMAMAAAAATGSVQPSVGYMLFFGLGTVPVMLVTSLSGKLLGARFRRNMQKLIPAGALVLAVLLVLRGLSLGIPYISPKLDSNKMAAGQMRCH
jgi:sulfite exporter TauE/SafE